MYSKSLQKTGICFFVQILVLFCIVVLSSNINADEFIFPKEYEAMYSYPEYWQLADKNERIKILNMLSKTLDGKLEKIKTISGCWTVEYNEGVNRDAINVLKFDTSTSAGNSSGIIKKSNFLLKFCIDRKNCKKFYSRDIIREWFESKGKDVTPQNSAVTNQKSIITKSDYLYSRSSPDVVFKVAELPDFPDLYTKKIAWRENAENTKNRGEFIDPFEYYGLREWSSPDFIIKIFNGEYGEDAKKNADNRIFLFETTDKKGAKWYRLRLLSGEGTQLSESNTFWSQSTSFLPCCRILKTPAGKIKNFREIKWKDYNESFFPEISNSIVYYDNGSLSCSRKLTAKDIEINKPIDPQQFSYSALGLGSGDILVDRIQQKVFTVKNDKPKFLAKFYEKYQAPQRQETNPVLRIVLASLGIGLIILGLYLKIRRKRI